MQVKRDNGSRQRCNFSEHVLEIYKLQQKFASLCCRRIVADGFLSHIPDACYKSILVLREPSVTISFNATILNKRPRKVLI